MIFRPHQTIAQLIARGRPWRARAGRGVQQRGEEAGECDLESAHRAYKGKLLPGRAVSQARVDFMTA